MYKLRIIAFSLMMLIFIPIIAIPVQVKADSTVSAFARLAGTSGPVLSAVSSCVLGIIFDKAYAYVKATFVTVGKFLAGNVNADTFDTTRMKAQQDASDWKTYLKKNCWEPMEKAAAAVILNVLTQETVNWINGGMNGAPMFLTNPEKSFQDLQKSALGNFADIITGDKEGNYPFGVALLRDTLKQLKTAFSNDMKSNMKLALPSGITTVNFSANFKNGGWGALAASLMPQNNIFGAGFMMNTRVSNLLRGTSFTPADYLKTKLQKGFKDQKICANPAGLGAGGTYLTTTTATSGTPVDQICKVEKIATPGDVVMGKLDKSLGVTQDTLVNADQLNASITAVFDALMGQLINKGLAALGGVDDQVSDPNAGNGGNNGGNGDGGDNSYDAGNVTTPPTITGSASAGSLCGVALGNTADWKKAYPQFTIESGLGDKTYDKDVFDNSVPPVVIHKAGDVKSAGLITREGTLRKIILSENNIATWIINSLYSLDMCIPGPQSVGDSNIQDQVYGLIMKDYKYPGSSSDQVNEIYNAQFLNDHLGIMFFPDDKIKGPSEVTDIIRTAISRYAAALNHEYSHLKKLDVYSKARPLIDKLVYYQQTIQDNNKKVELIDGNISSLKDIQRKIRNWQATGGSLSDPVSKKMYDRIQAQFDFLIPTLDVSPYTSN